MNRNVSKRECSTRCQSTPKALQRVSRFLASFLVMLVLPVAAQTIANDPAPFSLHGFGTLGIARSSTDQARYVRDLSQPDGLTKNWNGKLDSVVGVQASYQVRDSVEVVAQAVSHYQSDGSFRPEWTWAYLKFDPGPNLTLRGGRLGTEFYMLADSRLVGYSYLPIRPPPDYYGALPFSYIDGMDALLTLTAGEGLLRAKLFTGVTRENVPLAEREWDLNHSRMSGGHVDYQQGSWLWRLGYTQIRFQNDLPLADVHRPLELLGAFEASSALSMAGKLSQFYSFGMAYDEGPLQLQLMLNRTKQESAILEDSRAAYLIAGYRMGKLTPYAGYSETRSTPKHLSSGLGPLVDTGIARVMADSHSDQHTVFLGLRWDCWHNIAFKAQVDQVRGTPQSIFPTRWERPGYDGKMNVISLGLDFIF